MNNKKYSVACIVGTCPELIKMAPVIHELKAKDWANVFVINTAQHQLQPYLSWTENL